MRFTNKTVEKMATNPKLFAIADTLSKLTVLEAKELVEILENDYGIKPANVSVPVGIVPAVEVVTVEQTEFDVYLKEIGGQKLHVIKKVNELMRLGLKESKELVDRCPGLLKEKVSKADAQGFKTELENVGAVIEIK
jgi:large subunit ribosomal protein L7/L12